MPTLEDMASVGGPVANTRDDYLAYVEACTEAGVKPIPSMADWIKAGKPAGPK